MQMLKQLSCARAELCVEKEEVGCLKSGMVTLFAGLDEKAIPGVDEKRLLVFRAAGTIICDNAQKWDGMQKICRSNKKYVKLRDDLRGGCSH